MDRDKESSTVNLDPSATAGASGSDDALSDLLYSPTEDTAQAHQPTDLGQMLLESGAIDEAKLSTAKTIASRTPGKSLLDIFYEMGVAEVAIQSAVALMSGLLFERVELNNLELKYLNQLGHDFCSENGVLPIRFESDRLIVGIVRPDNLIIVEEVRHKLGKSIKPVIVCRDDINSILESLKEDSPQTDSEFNVDEIIGDIEEDDVEVVDSKQEELDLEAMAGESPVIRYVNYIIFTAVKEGASDIHIEPQEKKLQVRFRIDGVLFKMMEPPVQMQAAIISRLKIMANLDISERRLPQDGRIRAMVHGRKLDLRMSTLPAGGGEKVVLRILDTRSINVSLDDLGMGEDALLIWKHQIAQPHGIILVTGPTGSGKTTTLYSSLGQMDREKLNISTVEDPVEYHLGGITQCQTHEKIGMTFSAALRALLRQDPDVVMVGEIRDAETALIAIQASLTGHLVLSTLHTNDAPSSITRLINIGVEPFLIGAAVNAVLAQRLVRRICKECKHQTPPEEHVAEHLALHGIAMDDIWVGQGCDKCRNTGYSGRVGLYEILILDDFLRDKTAGNPAVTEFRRMCIERGMVTLREDGFRKVQTGLTTVEEVLRVTESTI